MAEPTPLLPAQIEGAPPIPLRFFGDQVLRRTCKAVPTITGEIVELAERMLVTMEQEGGIGLAAPQVGVDIRLFTHGLGDQAPPVLVNPEIVESRGTWTYQEGCLSIPGLYYELDRPKEIHVRAWSIDGEQLDFDADELLSRVIQHESDHLDGLLCVDWLEGDVRAAAERELRSRVGGSLGANDPFLTGKPIQALVRRRRSGRPLT